MKPMNNPVYIKIFLFLFAFVLYANTLNHDYVLDDFSVIKENIIVKKGLDGIGEIFSTHYRAGYGFANGNLFRPLSLSLFALQWEIAPNQPSLAHWFNVILFAILGLLLYQFIYVLSKNQLLSLITSLLFIAHPIHTEVVANIKSVDDILSMLFSLGGMLILFKHLSADVKDKKLIPLSLLLFFLAFLSKESTITYIGLVFFILILFYKKPILDAVKITALFLIPFSAYLLLRIKALGSISGAKTIAKIDNLLLAAPDEATKISHCNKNHGTLFMEIGFSSPFNE